MRVIILGYTGMLGRYLYTYFKSNHETIGIDRKILDAETVGIDEVKDFLQKYVDGTETIVINCMGLIPQRNDMKEIRRYVKVNAIFPHLIASCCEIFHMKSIHITTDCVFTGTTGEYNENSIHDEKNIYGMTKSLGEPTNCCVIRTSLIGEELCNKKGLFEWVKSQDGKVINGFVNHYWNGVTCLQLSIIIGKMIDENIYWRGVRHIFTPKSISKYDLIKEIINVYNLNITVIKMETDLVDKSLSSNFSPICEIPSYREQIISMTTFSIDV